MSGRFFTITALLLLSVQAAAFPLPSPSQQFQASRLSQPLQGDYDFTNIVRLSNCSGSIVRFHQSQPQDQAMVLTNGHCIGEFPEPGQAIVGADSQRGFMILDSHGEDMAEVSADRLLYATMTKTDVALYRLTMTYAELKSKYNIDGLELTQEVAALQTPIEVLSGYWRRGYSCAVEKIVYQLKEADWTDEESIRYTEPGCEVIGGTSGSPVLSQDRVVLGINNTGNEDGERCLEDNPCEIDESGKVDYAKGRSYAQQVFWFYGCVNSSREIDVRQDTCLLPH